MMSDQEQGATPQPAITAQAVLGLPQGCRVILNRTMSALALQMIASAAPDVAGGLESINAQTAVLVAANDDVVELRFENAISLPASGGRPALSCHNVVARLSRTGEGKFEFSSSAAGPDPQGPPLAYNIAGLTAAVQSPPIIVFSAHGEPALRVIPSAGPGLPVNMDAFTAPYVSKLPGFLRSFAPDTLSLLSLTQLP